MEFLDGGKFGERFFGGSTGICFGFSVWGDFLILFLGAFCIIWVLDGKGWTTEKASALSAFYRIYKMLGSVSDDRVALCATIRRCSLSRCHRHDTAYTNGIPLQLSSQHIVFQSIRYSATLPLRRHATNHIFYRNLPVCLAKSQ